MNNPIDYKSFVGTQLNAFKSCYVSLTIKLSISHLLNDRTVLFQIIQFSKSTKLNSFKYCCISPTIQLNSSHLFAHS